METKIEKALLGDKEISSWYEITSDALIVYASPEDKAAKLPEFTLRFGSKEKAAQAFPSFENPHTPLKGLRVAIDPGHIGGRFARLEEKYVHMLPNEEKGIYQEIEFNEGELAVLTAKKLAQKLKSLGAKVLLTKTSAGDPVVKKDYESWLENDFDSAVSVLVQRQTDPLLQEKEEQYWKTEAPPTQVFKSTYNFLDIERRAELINAFAPHVTITCHYNLGLGYDSDGYTPGTKTDYTLFFIPGAFQKGNLKDETFRKSSLKNERSRYEFVRLLVTDDIEQSLKLASIAKEYTKQILKLPIATSPGFGLKATYPVEVPGVFHRNLMMTRLVHGPILYCEPFLQDNYTQAKSLFENPDERIDEMVQIYTQSLLDWANSNQE